LSASQIALLKKVLAQSMRFRASDPDNLVLLPTGAVAVGQTWTPARSALDRWARQNPLTRKMRAAATGARFTLAAVDGDYASVRGTVQLRAAFAGKTVEPTMQLAFSLHMPTGRWLAQSIFLTLEAQLADAKLLVEGRQLCAIAFVPGKGRASPRPKGAHKLGWPAPGKDTNRFRDAARGLSLDVPAAYRPRVPAGGDMVAGFASAAGGHLAVSLKQMPQPVEMKEVLAKVLAGLKGTVKQFQLQETRPLPLAGNVPAVLVIGQGLGGRVNVIRLVAVDDRRVVSVAAAAPAEKPQLRTELTRIARTLRVFAPEPRRSDPAPRRP
jgi:hypothetical protein